VTPRRLSFNTWNRERRSSDSNAVSLCDTAFVVSVSARINAC
jgi:hypothetical protein